MKILFVGSFLSATTGSRGITETICSLLASENLDLKLTSRFKNQILRFADILFNVLLSNYDVLHIDVYSGKAFHYAKVAGYVGKLRGKKVIMTLHGGRLAERARENLKFFYRTLKRADVITSPSLFTKEYFEKLGFEVCYLPNPLDLKRFPYKEQRISMGSYRLLWVRAFSKIYNPHIPILALKSILNFCPSASLTMIGPDKGELQRAKNIIQELGLERKVDIVGPVKNDELFQYYHSHDVYLNTTSYESFGVSVMEAAGCGLPLVSHKVGELPFIWKEAEEILFVNEGDYEAMGRAVMKLHNDMNLARTLSQNARRRAEEFSWPNIRPLWFRILDLNDNHQ